MKARRRFQKHYAAGRAMTLAEDHPAAREGRTLFPSRVGSAPIAWKGKTPLTVLKSGMHSRKIGSRVTKGAWKGFPIFTLTLEERATCPRSCLHWLSCYGNCMDKPTRHRHGAKLESDLAVEISGLQKRYPGGFVVRLHVLGDFYSVDYVETWRGLIAAYPALHVFGYTAWLQGSKIGDAIANLRACFEWRFVVRHSNAIDGFRTRSAKTADGLRAGEIVCPAQSHAKANSICCGSCALCWSAPNKTVVFLEH